MPEKAEGIPQRQEGSAAAIILNVGSATTALERIDATETVLTVSREAMEISERLGSKRLSGAHVHLHMGICFIVAASPKASTWPARCWKK